MPLLIILSQNRPLPDQLKIFIDFFDVSLDTSGILIGILYFLIVFFTIKFLFLLYLSYKQNLFVYNLQARLSTLMFRGISILHTVFTYNITPQS